jgi:hypothetical protein
MLNATQAFVKYSTAQKVQIPFSISSSYIITGADLAKGKVATYNAQTQTEVKAFQTAVNAASAAKASSPWNALVPTGKLAVSGSVDAKTWYALCYVQLGYNNNYIITAAARSYDESAAHTTAGWLEGSYMRAGNSAASSAGCQSLETKMAPVWNLQATTTMSTTQVNPGQSIKFNNTVTNKGPAATGSFTYGPRYFYSATATPTLSASGYPSEVLPVDPDASANINVNQSDSFLADASSLTDSGTVVVAKPAATTDKYICVTMAYSPSNSVGAKNGRSKPVCDLIFTGAATTTFSLSGVTTVAKTAAGVTFTSTLTNAGPDSTNGYKYGTYYYFTANDVTSSTGTYTGEVAAATKTVGTLIAKAASSAKIVQGPIKIPSVQPENEQYICGAVAFSPSTYVSSNTATSSSIGTSKPVCTTY